MDQGKNRLAFWHPTGQETINGTLNPSETLASQMVGEEMSAEHKLGATGGYTYIMTSNKITDADQWI